MKKIIAIMLAAVMACMMFAGCELSEGELGHIPDATEAATVPPVVEDVPETVSATEPAPDEGWTYGDEVWFVECDEYGDGWPYPGVVVEAADEHLIVSRGWDTDGDLVAAHLGDCYRTYDEAWAATGKTVVAGEECG